VKTKKVQLLEFIASKGDEGVTFTDCQRFACELNGFNFDEMQEERVWNGSEVVLQKRRRYRGYWCDYLLPSWGNRCTGILSTYCTKVGKRYILNDAGKAAIQ
jgi:hypothetical protein